MVDMSFFLNVVFYSSESGSEPVREWLKELPRDVKKQIGEDIKTALTRLGNHKRGKK